MKKNTINREQKIVKNIVAYTIGNFESKILVYVIVLVYTHFAFFISKTLANTLKIVYICTRQKECKERIKTPYNKKRIKNIAKDSFPLIPNNISWWTFNSFNRYIILFFLGTVVNSVYSIANKFLMIVTTVLLLFCTLQFKRQC